MSAKKVRLLGAPSDEVSVTVFPDDCIGVTDTACSALFGGDPVSAVTDLIRARSIRVNDAVICEEDLFINGAKALWKTPEGTWSWKAHIMFHGEGLSFPVAAAALVNGLSMLRGPSYTLTFSNGKVSTIDFQISDACFAQTVHTGEESTTLTICGNGDGSMNRTDPSTISFPNKLVECDQNGCVPSDQCLVLYWYDRDGWHLKRANSSRITLPDDEGQIFGSLLNLEYSEPFHRPTQPVQALSMMGLGRVETIQWFFRDDITSGISHADARPILHCALEKAEHAAAVTAISVAGDGSDTDASLPWVTQEYHDTFIEVIRRVKAVYETDGLHNSKYEEALYTLCLAYGGDGSFYSRDRNVFANGIGFVPFSLHRPDQNAK